MPGAIITTGPPIGVGMGFKPSKFLKQGDVITMEVDGIGRLSNPV
jgi:2-keto-4-pentenoate hydratase/2-oxohepta-3-ene-1,7-dioic acid hydratase in catechol pathway